MANIFDVAKYILEKSGRMTTMKLQKLCYYCQAWNLAWEEVPLFTNDFEAWANGPVCPELFNAHKGIFSVDQNFLKNEISYPFTDVEKENMDRVIAYYNKFEPHELSELTHLESPWKEARKNIPDGIPCHNIITKDSMLQYYSGL